MFYYIAVTSPSPGSSAGINFVYSGSFAEQDDGHKDLSRYAISENWPLFGITFMCNFSVTLVRCSIKCISCKLIISTEVDSPA